MTRGRVSAKAVIIGTLVDIFGTMLLSSVFAMVVSVDLVRSGVAPEDVSAHLAASDIYRVGAFLIGSGLSFFGAYLAARVAGILPYLHAFMVGGICLLWNLVAALLWPAAFDATPPWALVAGLILTFPLSAAGGFVASRRSAV